VPRSGPLNDIVLAPNGRTALGAGPVGVSLLRVPSGKLVHSWTTPRLFPGTDNVAVYSMTMNPRGTRAYVLNSTFAGATAVHGAVRVINTRTGVLGPRIRTGLTPQAVAVDAATNTGYVANWGSRSLTLFPLHP